MNELVRALGGIQTVEGIGLGGSRGLSLATEQSDFDFVLYRRGGANISAQEIIEKITPYVDENSVVCQAGFVSAQKAGRKVEFFQKDMLAVRREISLAREGKFRWMLHDLYPHGYLTTGQISHVVYLRLCLEKNKCLTQLRDETQPFPPLLRRSLTETFMRQASITFLHAAKIKKPQDLLYLVGLCSAFVFYLNIVIYACNNMYPVLERGGVMLIGRMPNAPANYLERINRLLMKTAELSFTEVVSEMKSLIDEVRGNLSR